MRYTLFLIMIMAGLWACSNDDASSFSPEMPKEGDIWFKPVQGGAMMKYTLPDDKSIFSINVRYTDCRNIEVLKAGGYACDSLFLDGFNEARKDVPVRITMVNNNNEESESVNLTFDTKDSAPYAFFENVNVLSFWGGFQVIYDVEERASGMVHVFYLGSNPLTHQLDTILLKSLPITRGGDTLVFQLQQERPLNTVIVRTEDFRGYRVKQQVWSDIESYFMKKMDSSTIEFIDPSGKLIVENEEDKAGLKYLFDGDTKGTQRMKAGKVNEVYTFVAGPSAVNAPFIIDLQTENVVAGIRIYGILNNDMCIFPGPWDSYYLVPVWSGEYHSKLPCRVTVYGGSSRNPNASDWVKLGHFKQAANLYATERWSLPCIQDIQSVESIDELNAANPAYMEILFAATPVKYRFLKMVVEDVFDNTWGANYNRDEYVTMHELEIYVKQE